MVQTDGLGVGRLSGGKVFWGMSGSKDAEPACWLWQDYVSQPTGPDVTEVRDIPVRFSSGGENAGVTQVERLALVSRVNGKDGQDTAD